MRATVQGWLSSRADRAQVAGPPLGPQPAWPRGTPAPTAAPRASKPRLDPARGRGWPREEGSRRISAGNWAAPSIIAVGGAGPKERGAGESVSQELGRRPRSSPSFGDGGGDEIDEAGSCGAVGFFFFSLFGTGSGLTYERTAGAISIK